MSKTVSWSDVRAKRPVDDSAVAEHVARMEAEEQAYRLREIREEQGVTQKELAERMNLTQPTISALEAGDLDRSGLATLRAYVEALGGTVEVTATFGGRKIVLSQRNVVRGRGWGPSVGGRKVGGGRQAGTPRGKTG